MKTLPMMKLSIFSLAVCGMLFGAVGETSAQVLNWAEKMFEVRKHDFGSVARGAEARYRFKFTNNYKETVHVSNVRTTCGCTESFASKKVIESGETAYIEVAMDTNKFSHDKNSNAIVTFSQPQYSEVRLPIHAYIRTDVVLTPGWANFKTIDAGEPKTMNLQVSYSGRSDWKLTDIISNNPHVEAEATEKSRTTFSVRYDLKVTLKDTAPLGTFRDRIILVTNDSRNPKVPVLVEANLESELMIASPKLPLNNLFPGEQKKVNVIIKGKQPFMVEKVECETHPDMFEVKLPKEPKKVQIVQMLVNPPSEAGTLNEQFTVKIADRETPLKFEAYGRVVVLE